MPDVSLITMLGGQPQSGIPCAAYKATRFGALPVAYDTATPGGAPDASAVSGLAFGGVGAVVLTVPTTEQYWIAMTSGGHTAWVEAPAIIIPESSGALAARPAANLFGQGFYLATDVNNGTLFYSNGVIWSQVAPGVTAPGDIAYQVAFGSAAGVTIPPWRVPQTFGDELWTLANFRVGGGWNSTVLMPSLVANGTNQTMRTLCSIGTLQEDQAFRLKGTVASMPSVSGWCGVTVRLVDAAGADLVGTNPQTLLQNNFAWAGTDFVFDFKPGNLLGSGASIEIDIATYSNCPSGTLALSNLSLKEIAADSRPMYYTGPNSTVPAPLLHQRLYNRVTGKWQNFSTSLNADTVLGAALNQVNVYDGPSPWRWPPADPLFLAPTGNVTTQVGSNEEIATAALSRIARVNNNDQIIEVQKADLSWELRCNTHGGETLITAAPPNLIYEIDKAGDGVWTTWDGTGGMLRTCRRFRFTFNTQIARSAPDSDVFATTTHVCTFFPDGMMRCDRTTTFLKSVVIRTQLDWMSSHDVATPKIGRIGHGQVVDADVDIYTRVAVPAAATAVTAGTGGTLAAGTYTYKITALTEGGETTASPAVAQVTVGATSTVTLTRPALGAGATGWRVYGRNGNLGQQVLLATIAATATTWVDDGSITAFGPQPPSINTARRYDQPTTIQVASGGSDVATWAVWKDLPTGMCFGNIYDRDSVLARPGVAGTRTKLENFGGGVKNYQIVIWAAGASSPVANGTVWSSTHWAFCYLPQNPDRYEQEIAQRASYLGSLKSIYPAV